MALGDSQANSDGVVHNLPTQPVDGGSCSDARREPDDTGETPMPEMYESALRSALQELAGLRQAMETRAVIEQAKGVIMASAQCDADHAFHLLRQQSQHENRKLHEIATEVVAHASRNGRPRPA